jgi:hypothetical protein
MVEILADSNKFSTAVVSLLKIDENNYKIDAIKLQFD